MKINNIFLKTKINQLNQIILLAIKNKQTKNNLFTFQ